MSRVYLIHCLLLCSGRFHSGLTVPTVGRSLRLVLTENRYIWPISHIKPAIPELRFLCWAYSFMAQRVATSCETLLGVSKAADQDIKDQILSQSEAGFKIVEVSEMLGRSVNDIISVFQLPNVTGEIWQVIDAVTQLADKRLGMTELVYGMTDKQIRSATEASVKSDQISIRPDDMAEVLENSA